MNYQDYSYPFVAYMNYQDYSYPFVAYGQIYKLRELMNYNCKTYNYGIINRSIYWPITDTIIMQYTFRQEINKPS